MTGDSGTGRNGVHFYYKCVNRKKNHICDKKTVEKNYIENYVILATKEFLKNCKEVKDIAKGVTILFNDNIAKDTILF